MALLQLVLNNTRRGNSLIRYTLRAALLATTLAVPSIANADTDDQYLPRDILVTGDRGDGYDVEDGSTATKTDTPLIDVPQTVYVITEEQLDDQGIRSLGDALRYAPGVSLESGEGHRDEVFIRGQETTADFYIDGLRDDAQYYRPLYNVSRIEVLKGANALIFGRGGGGGVINRVTKKADPLDTAASIDGSIDSFGAWALATDVNQPVGDGVAVRLNATYEEFASNRDVYEGRFIGVSPTLTAFVGPDTTITASYTYDDDERVTDRGIPSLNGRPIEGYYDTFFGDEDYNRAFVEAHIARARIDHEFSPALSANASIQYADYDKFYANIVPTGATETTVSLGGYQDGTQRENFIGQINLIGELATGGIGHTVLLGGEIATSDTLNMRDRVRFDDGATSATVALDDEIFVPAFGTEFQRRRGSDVTVTSFYVQDQIAFGDMFDVIAGVRYDEFDIDAQTFADGGAVTSETARVDSRWSPRVGVVVKPVERLSLYASYTETFLPQSGDQFVTLSQLDSQLDPEKFENIEAGIKYAIRPDLFATASLFRLTRSNTPATDPNDATQTILTGESEVSGLEINLVGQVATGLQANLAYTYLDGEITEDSDFADAGTRLQQLPRHQIAAWTRYDFLPAFGIGAGLVHQSDQFASFGNGVVLPAYTRIDAALFWEPTDRLALQLNVENLTDEEYFPSAHGDNNIAPGDAFNARLTARLNF